VSQVAAVDQLSGGRAILTVGLGALRDDPAAARSQVLPWAEAGCTWWLETRWEMPHHTPDRMRQVRQRLAAGPPAVPDQAANNI
jgi:alkanesulfonate monooxygenase SsuD/methylene tetrahydromethanopterin reductase-like flavin-dependent oxidoreductase (luciferase family)